MLQQKWQKKAGGNGMDEQKKLYKYRFIARIVLEAKTALAIGSGEKNMLTDQLVLRDVNGLPYIPGTAIAGVVRHAIGEEKAKSFFGFNESRKERENRMRKDKEAKENIDEGSQVIFSSAQIVGKDGKVVEQIVPDVFSDDYLQHFRDMPIRQHVCIDEKGTAKDKGKFDEEIVYKGTRFCFEIEMLSERNEEAFFDEIISVLASGNLQIGSGTRSGHGEMEVVCCQTAMLDLTNSDHLELYIKKTSSLNDNFWNGLPVKDKSIRELNNDGWTEYKLILNPEDFFLFSSGFGNKQADTAPVFELSFVWETTAEGFQYPVPRKDCVLIPGSSVKGALAHRVAFHYNKMKDVFADEIDAGDFEKHTGCNNNAVKALFGYTENDTAKRGNVIFSDIIQERGIAQNKLLNHVAIDRFTGGAMDGALFSEEVIFGKNERYILFFKVDNAVLQEVDCIEGNTVHIFQEVLERSLTDIACGLLPLGGGINRGHGCFTGKIIRNKEEIFSYGNE